MSGTEPRRVRADVPSWIWGNNTSAFLNEAALWQSKPDDSGYSQIQTVESYYRRRNPDLIESGLVLSPDGKERGSASWLYNFGDPSIDQPLHVKARAHPDFEAPTTGHPIVDVAEWGKRAAMFTPGPRLLDRAKEILSTLHRATLADSGESLFPQASVLAFRRTPALLHRVKLSAVLLRLSNDSRLREGDPSELKKLAKDAKPAFGAGSELTSGLLVMDAYIQPLLAAMTPHVWGFAVPRIGGILVFSYGRAVSGTRRWPSGLLDTLHLPGRADSVEVTEFRDPEAPERATHWWAHALNSLFGTITDPVTFATRSAAYDIDLAFQTVLTVEQIFRRVASSQMADGDVYGRRAAMFSAIDALEGMTGYPVARMLSPDHARETLRRVESAIPQPAGEVLLPAARRAVAGLESVEAGFYLRNPDGRIPTGPDQQPLEPEAAAAKYMYLLRNATHGFSGKQALKGGGAVLLAAHTGDVHHDTGLLGWLYILDVLADPDRLRKVLRARASRNA